MKKHWLIAVGVVLLAVSATLVWKYRPRTVPVEECSELYRRYSDSSHICASYIKDFRVNDSLTLDVTVLEALDSAGWAGLLKDFDITPLPQEALEFLGLDTNAVTFWKVHKTDFTPVDDPLCTDFYLIVLQECRRTITFFSIENAAQSRAVFTRELTEMGNSKTL